MDRISSGRYKRDVADSIEQLSFELTVGALGEQERAASSLKVSAGTILGAASITISLLAARVAGHSSKPWAVLAVIAYGLCFASAIWVLLPRELVTSFSGAKLMADGDSDRANDVAEGYRVASIWIEPWLGRNRRTLDRMSDWLTISCLLLAVEVALCTIGLTS